MGWRIYHYTRKCLGLLTFWLLSYLAALTFAVAFLFSRKCDSRFSRSLWSFGERELTHVGPYAVTRIKEQTEEYFVFFPRFFCEIVDHSHALIFALRSSSPTRLLQCCRCRMTSLASCCFKHTQTNKKRIGFIRIAPLPTSPPAPSPP